MSKPPSGHRNAYTGATRDPLAEKGSLVQRQLDEDQKAASSDLPEPWMYAVTVIIAAAAAILIFWIQW